MSAPAKNATQLVLGVDTCGEGGTIALSRVGGGAARLLGERVLPVRDAAAAIVCELESLLVASGAGRSEIGVIVVVSGPGSFTGVRIGVSTALGLGAGLGAKLVAVSRLELLAALGGCGESALDAHRGEVYLRVDGRESLANQDELKRAGLAGRRVAVCEEAAAELLRQAAPDAVMARVAEPAAGFAIAHALGRIERGEFTEAMALDGNYLRRSDAEIFWKMPRDAR